MAKGRSANLDHALRWYPGFPGRLDGVQYGLAPDDAKKR